MCIRLLITLYFVTFFSSNEVNAESENEVKRGIFPFMAFLYYPDESVKESNGGRFRRSAVLIRPDWLLSSAVDPVVIDNVQLGFPRKTLLARLGAISIDANFTLNEDEDEQELEVIEIVRPKIHNGEAWWFTDITLLKTLLPFKITSAVAVARTNPKRDYVDKNCFILVYAKKYANVSNENVLMQLSVDLLPPSTENCGNQFSETTMTCGIDSDDTKTAIYDPDFCQGNRGGPLLCDGEVAGLQTYIDNRCTQPHLYQLFSSWDGLISCGTQQKCHQDYCSNICTVTEKDIPGTEFSSTFTTETTITSIQTEVTELVDVTEESILTASREILPTTEEVTTALENQTTKEVGTQSPTTAEITEPHQSSTTTTVTQTTKLITIPTPKTSSPKEKSTENSRRRMAESVDTASSYSEERKVPKVGKLHKIRRSEEEEKKEEKKVEEQKPSAAVRNMCLLQTFFIGVFVLKCVT